MMNVFFIKCSSQDCIKKQCESRDLNSVESLLVRSDITKNCSGLGKAPVCSVSL